MSEPLRIKGSNIRSKLAFALDRFGDDAELALMEVIRDAGHRQILEGSWYPFELYTAVLEELATRCFGGDLSRLVEVGAYSAERALTTTYDAYAQRQALSRFLERLPSLHKRFYSAGDIVVDYDGSQPFCTIRMHGLDRYHDADLHIAQGFYRGAAAVFGLADPRCDFTPQFDGVEFRLEWREE